MARTKHSQRRTDHHPPANDDGTGGNPITIDSSPPAPAGPRETPAETQVVMRTRQDPRKANGGSRTKAALESKALLKKAVKNAPKGPAPKRECSICASSKSIPHSFRLVKESDEDVCEHFKHTCGQCIKRLATDKVEKRQLAETGLACIFPECNHILAHELLKSAFTMKEQFSKYDTALTQAFLTANPNFISCLSSDCGLYFSTEACDKSTDPKASQAIACPYCDSQLCLKCNRPWHANKDCNKAKEAEDAASLREIKAMGAKPCPNCGLNIEKEGGCDHMSCQKCQHHFCWQCLVPYTGAVQHLDGCRNALANVAQNPANWMPENATVEQVNRMFERAAREMDNVFAMMPQLQANAPVLEMDQDGARPMVLNMNLPARPAAPPPPAAPPEAPLRPDRIRPAPPAAPPHVALLEAPVRPNRVRPAAPAANPLVENQFGQFAAVPFFNFANNFPPMFEGFFADGWPFGGGNNNGGNGNGNGNGGGNDNGNAGRNPGRNPGRNGGGA